MQQRTFRSFGMNHQEGGTMAANVNGKTTFGLATLLKQTFWLTNENIGKFVKSFGTGNSSSDIKSFLNENTTGGYRNGAVK